MTIHLRMTGSCRLTLAEGEAVLQYLQQSDRMTKDEMARIFDGDRLQVAALRRARKKLWQAQYEAASRAPADDDPDQEPPAVDFTPPLILLT